MSNFVKSLVKVLTVLATVYLVGSLRTEYSKYKVNADSRTLYKELGSQVVKLTDASGRSGGTGFAIKTPHNQVYILTNAHICIALKEEIYANYSNNRKTKLTIMEVSNNTDLCILSGLNTLNGLSLGKTITSSDNIMSMGYPLLMPLTVSKGQFFEYNYIDVAFYAGTCVEEEGMYKTYQNGPFGTICVIHVLAAYTNVPTYPGNSGSPVLDVWGNVVGVIFASDNETHYGQMIPLNDIKNFIKNY